MKVTKITMVKFVNKITRKKYSALNCNKTSYLTADQLCASKYNNCYITKS